MEVVVQSERPETHNRRNLSLGKGDSVGVLAVELFCLAVFVPVDVLGFLRPIVEHVRLSGRGVVEIVGSPLRIVHWRVPAVADGTAVVTPLKEWIDQFAL